MSENKFCGLKLIIIMGYYVLGGKMSRCFDLFCLSEINPSSHYNIVSQILAGLYNKNECKKYVHFLRFREWQTNKRIKVAL